MDNIFAQAKNILIVWVDDVDPEKVPAFQKLIEPKAKQAEITSENVQILLESRHTASSIDIILFGLISNKNISTNLDLINEFFRLLRPNGHLVTHLDQSQQKQATSHFKMCGFSDCNPLDANSSFLIENKDDNAKRVGSLWLCQKPSYDIGYSVSLFQNRPTLIKQKSMPGGKKTWMVEDEDEEDLSDENDPNEHHVKTPEPKQDERTTVQQNVKSGRNSYADNTFQSTNSPTYGVSPFKPGEHVNLSKMSDV